jgi:hypothetical protein
VDALLLSHGADLPLADRLPGHAPRAADHAGASGDGRPRAGGPRPGGAPGGRRRHAVRASSPGPTPRTPSTGSSRSSRGRGSPRRASGLAISDRAWTTTLLALQRRLPEARWIEASG